jgi:hypothetical protein
MRNVAIIIKMIRFHKLFMLQFKTKTNYTGLLLAKQRQN